MPHLAGLAYLQYQQRAKINWDKLQSVSQGAISNLATTATQISDNIGGHDHTSAIAMANFGIPLESLEMMLPDPIVESRKSHFLPPEWYPL